MLVTEAQRIKYLELIDQILSPQSLVTEEDVFAWLETQDNGEEIALEDVSLFFAGDPERVARRPDPQQ